MFSDKKNAIFFSLNSWQIFIFKCFNRWLDNWYSARKWLRWWCIMPSCTFCVIILNSRKCNCNVVVQNFKIEITIKIVECNLKLCYIFRLLMDLICLLPRKWMELHYMVINNLISFCIFVRGEIINLSSTFYVQCINVVVPLNFSIFFITDLVAFSKHLYIEIWI